MAELVSLSTTDASNTGTLGFPEGMAPSAVNDKARALEGALARFLADTNGSLTSAGGTTAYTLAINSTTTAAARGEFFVFKVNATNTGAVTINITPSGGSARGAVAVQANGAAMAAGEWVANSIVAIWYDGTQFQSISPPALGVAHTWSAAQTFSAGIIFANETLSTYDEFTWTPTMSDSGGGGSVTYTTQTGVGIKIGQMVHLGATLDVNSFGTLSGDARFAGFPFTVQNSAQNCWGGLFHYIDQINLTAGKSWATLQCAANTTYAVAVEHGDAATSATLGIAALTSGGNGAYQYTVSFRATA